MKKKNFIIIALLILLLSSCGKTNKFKIPYFDEISEDGSYNSNMFYRNDLNISQAADPNVIYVSEDDDYKYGGYFYMYVTGLGYPCFRSKDLNNWEKVGNTLMLGTSSWCEGTYWAPEVIYNKEEELYYMYYTCSSRQGDNTTEYSNSSNAFDRLYIGIARSKTPVGPFDIFTGENQDNKIITRFTPPINFKLSCKDKEFSWGTIENDFGVIDVNPFIDDNGDLYLYFVKHQGSYSSLNEIWGMKMKDYITPDYDTLTPLLMPGRKTYNGELINGETSNTINEGPFMIKYNNCYYLTYSAFGSADRMYSVCASYGDSPLGQFTKFSYEKANPVVGIESYFDQMSGTGHHTFLKVGDEYYTIYHGHINRTIGGGTRGIAIDPLYFIYDNEMKMYIPHVNGPSYSIQPLPSFASGNVNLNKECTISATNIANEDGIGYLNDDIVPYHFYDETKELEVANKTKITVKFNSPQLVSAVLVYNSLNYDYAFNKIDSIIFDVVEKPSNYIGKFYKQGIINNIDFNKSYINDVDKVMRPGGAAVAEFDSLLVSAITINISSKITNKDYYGNSNRNIRISEIKVLGKLVD